MESIHQLALFGHFEKLKQEYKTSHAELVGSLKKALDFMEDVYRKEGTFSKTETFALYRELGNYVKANDKEYTLNSEILEIQQLQQSRKPMQKATAKPQKEQAKKKKLG